MSLKGSPASLVPCSYGPWEEKRGWLQHLPSGGHMEVLLTSTSAAHLPPRPQSPLSPILFQTKCGQSGQDTPSQAAPLASSEFFLPYSQVVLWPLEPEASTAHLPLHLPHPALFILAAKTEPRALYPFRLGKAFHGNL